jgi:hypothetical protein
MQPVRNNGRANDSSVSVIRIWTPWGRPRVLLNSELEQTTFGTAPLQLRSGLRTKKVPTKINNYYNNNVVNYMNFV